MTCLPGETQRKDASVERFESEAQFNICVRMHVNCRIFGRYITWREFLEKMVGGSNGSICGGV